MIRIKEDRKNKRTVATIDKAKLRFRRGIKNALHDIGSENVRHLRGLIRKKDKTGRLYFFRGRIHQASSPGQAPASMTGRLARTAGYKVRGVYQVEFGDKAPYGKFLEEGTKRMAPRPHVERTVREKERDNFRSLADQTHQEIIKL